METGGVSCARRYPFERFSISICPSKRIAGQHKLNLNDYYYLCLCGAANPGCSRLSGGFFATRESLPASKLTCECQSAANCELSVGSESLHRARHLILTASSKSVASARTRASLWRTAFESTA